MARSSSELRERLLRAGVAPRHVRRYLSELADHLADLRREEQGAGHGREDAESRALIRLGGVEALAAAMIEQRGLRSWCARAPWALFGAGPLVVLAGAYFLAGLILLSGWRMFLPGTDSPFIGPLHGLAIPYFAVGKWDYFTAPFFIGWGIALFAARQRSKPVWPLVGLTLNALVAGGAQFHAARPHLPGATERVSVGFTLEPGSLVHGLGILALTAAPYLVWLLARTFLDHRSAAHGSEAAFEEQG